MTSMIVTYIGEATEKNRFSLPYGMVLTLLFRELGLDIPEDESVKELRHSDYCNDATLHKIGYKKQESTWVRIHLTKQSTFITQNDLPSSTAPIPELQPCFDTQIPESSETPVPNVPQYLILHFPS